MGIISKMLMHNNDNQNYSQIFTAGVPFMVTTRPTRLRQAIRTALCFSLAPFSLLTSQSVLAEEVVQKDSQAVETIVVTASALKVDTPAQETPQSISVITQEDLEQKNVQKLDEAFRYTSGVATQVYGSDNNSEWFRVRGFEATRYLDGNRLYKDGYYAWVIEPFGLEQLELLKGPSSIQFGESYPGGVVNAVQKKPTDAPQGSFSASVGNLDSRQFSLDVSDWANEDGSQRYRLVATYKGEDGVLDYTENERVYIAPSYSIDFSEDTSLTLLASFLKDDGTPTGGFFPAYGTYFDTAQGKISPSTNYGDPSYETNEVTQVSLGYLIEHQINDIWAFNQNFNYGYQDLKLISSTYGWSSNLNTSFDNLSRDIVYDEGDVHSLTLDNKFMAKFDTSNVSHTLVAGVDAQYFRNKFKHLDSFGAWGGGASLNDAFNPSYGGETPDLSSATQNKREKSQLGLYAQYQAEVYQNLIANLGARYDYVDFENTAASTETSGNVDNTTFNAGLMYLSDMGLSPYISYAEAFEVLTSIDSSTGEVYKPQRGKQYEVGVKYTPSFLNGYINLAWFDLTQENALTSVGSYTIQSSDTDEVVSRGVEVESVIQATDALRISATYTYTDAKEVSKTKGEIDAVLIPEQQASLWVDYNVASLNLPELTVGTGVRYVGESIGYQSWGNYDDKYIVSSYTLVDLMAKYDISKQWQAQVNVSNALDKEYLASCNSGYCYYGDTQRITATVNYNW